MDTFTRLAPFIQDFIYQNKWEELRGIQVAAAEIIFDSDDNLLLSFGTASGKTEAAFLPEKAESLSSFSVGQGVFPAAPRKHGNNPQAPTGRNQIPN